MSPAGGRVDTHFHIVPPSYAAALAAAGGDRNHPGPTPAAWDAGGATQAAAFCEGAGIDFAVLSVTAPGPAVVGPGPAGRALARACNIETAAAVAEGGGRYGFFASRPDWNDVDGVLEELDFVFGLQKVANGVVVMASYGGRLLGDTLFEPVWRALDAVGALVFLHPCCTAVADGTGSEALPPIAGGLPGAVLDYPLATTRTAADLVLR